MAKHQEAATIHCTCTIPGTRSARSFLPNITENALMNLKTKAFGLVAGTALSLSLVTGVMAQSTTAAVEPNAAGSCTAAASSGAINLGTWAWNGTTKVYDYTAPTTPGSITTNVSQDIQPNIDCNVTLSVGTLTGSNGGTITGVADTAASGGTGSAGTYSVPTDVDGTALVVTASLASIPAAAVPGTYTGTITVSGATAAP